MHSPRPGAILVARDSLLTGEFTRHICHALALDLADNRQDWHLAAIGMKGETDPRHIVCSRPPAKTTGKANSQREGQNPSPKKKSSKEESPKEESPKEESPKEESPEEKVSQTPPRSLQVRPASSFQRELIDVTGIYLDPEQLFLKWGIRPKNGWVRPTGRPELQDLQSREALTSLTEAHRSQAQVVASAVEEKVDQIDKDRPFSSSRPIRYHRPYLMDLIGSYPWETPEDPAGG